jgi:hypothetical protein
MEEKKGKKNLGYGTRANFMSHFTSFMPLCFHHLKDPTHNDSDDSDYKMRMTIATSLKGLL